MAIQALNSAATGLRALSTRIDVVANNLANAETNAFKGSRVNFEDLMYEQLKAPGTVNQAGDISPAGIFVGLGVKFINPQGLSNLGGSIYTETDASGKPFETNPGENGAGTIQQGYLEGSNVDPVKELVTLIKTQRAFELNSQSIQTADQALQTIANL